MKIRQATPQDLPRLMEIFADARQFMAQHGNPNQWGPSNWPPEALIQEDIAQGHSYVCVNDAGIVIGTFYLAVGNDIEPDYATIEGKWIGDNHYGVVHRIASDGSEKGIGTFCLTWAFEQCGHIRIDTHADNIVLQRLLEKLGYTCCGTIYLAKNHESRLAYEKKMTKGNN